MFGSVFECATAIAWMVLWWLRLHSWPARGTDSFYERLKLVAALDDLAHRRFGQFAGLVFVFGDFQTIQESKVLAVLMPAKMA